MPSFQGLCSPHVNPGLRLGVLASALGCPASGFQRLLIDIFGTAPPELGVSRGSASALPPTGVRACPSGYSAMISMPLISGF